VSEKIMADIPSGVSWLYDQLVERAADRVVSLQEGIAEGVPIHEYQAMVGRYKETKRWLHIEIPEIFEAFNVESEADDDELEEISDDE